MSERLVVSGWPLTYGGRTYEPGEEIAREAIPPAQIPALLGNGGLRVEKDPEADEEAEESVEEAEDVLGYSVAALRSEIASWGDVGDLRALLDAERETRDRKGAVEAIEARIAEIEGE